MRILVFSILLFCGVAVYGQSSWQVYYEENGIKFFVQDASCSWEGSPSIDYKFIKIENNANRKAQVSYRLKVYYGEQCNGCDGSAESLSTVVLEPGMQIQGTCNYMIPARLDILVRNPNLPALQFTQFSITDISIDWID